jgi:hypothetical protein
MTWHVVELSKPERRELTKEFALSRDRVRENAVKGRDPISCHDQKSVSNIENLANFSTAHLSNAWELD